MLLEKLPALKKQRSGCWITGQVPLAWATNGVVGLGNQ
jgi:hypothetical protein